MGMTIASLRDALAFSNPATSSHLTFGFSVTMAVERLVLNALYPSSNLLIENNFTFIFHFLDHQRYLYFFSSLTFYQVEGHFIYLIIVKVIIIEVNFIMADLLYIDPNMISCFRVPSCIPLLFL